MAGVTLGVTAIALVALGAFLATRRNDPLTKDFREQLGGKGAGKMFTISTALLVGLYVIVSRLRQDILPILMKAYFCYVLVMMAINFLRPFLFRSIYPGSLDNPPQYLVKWMKLYAVDLVSVAAALPLLLIYWLSDNWIVMNFLAALVALFSIEITRFKTLTIASITLVAFFFYDIYFVFFTPIMLTVAKKVVIPVKIVWPREFYTFSIWTSYSDTAKFALLGLGDIILPGVYIALVSRIEAQIAATKGLVVRPSLTQACIAAYAVSIIVAMCVLYFSQKGQPVLLYIVPSLLSTTYGLMYCKYDRDLRDAVVSYVDEDDDEIVPFKPGAKSKAGAAREDEHIDNQEGDKSLSCTEEARTLLDVPEVDTNGMNGMNGITDKDDRGDRNDTPADNDNSNTVVDQ